MGQLYLTRKWIQSQQSEALMREMAAKGIFPAVPHLRRLSSTRSDSLVSNYLNNNDVEDLEMLLEAYFMQLDGTRNKILSLRQLLSHKSSYNNMPDQMIAQDNGMQSPTAGKWLPVPEAAEGLQAELPFEFQVLEVALEVVCTYLDSSVAELERDAYPVLDELARNVSTKNLEHVRSLKSNLTQLLAQVQKVRDEIEHLLDDDEDMGQLYLTRKWIQSQQSEALMGEMAAKGIFPSVPHLRRLSSTRSDSLVSNYLNNNDVEELEMLLEAYFMQLDGTRNKILSVREYVDDTEDYVNIQLDNQRNELIQLQLTLTIASFAIAVETMMAGWFGMNIPCTLYNINGIFGLCVGIMTAACVLLFILVLGYARWKKLLGP
ncbi:unnamed protein product [Fraxinus pennsylvanica]|uniref:Magnesium transporter n=1 Tax=Fraxinus pennsylvanica TaxID=56036 RepID=A0AAD2DSC7_9LAMI|nr:unnamed protein product [Fraxinus pennsylvanica]